MTQVSLVLDGAALVDLVVVVDDGLEVLVAALGDGLDDTTPKMFECRFSRWTSRRTSYVGYTWIDVTRR